MQSRVAQIAFLLILLAAAGVAAQMLLTLTIGANKIEVEVADTDEARRQGLMFRESLAEDRGMIFCYPAPRRLSFWMKNTKIPLDIAFIDNDGTIAQIESMRALDETHTVSTGAVAFALEVNQGWFQRHGVAVGDRVQGLPRPK